MMDTITNARGDDLTRGQLSAVSGCNKETIRYYEKIGIMPEPRRSAGGHRLYGPSEAKRLAFICRSRELGFNLKQVRGLLDMADGEKTNCNDVRELTSGHLSAVQDKISDLKRLERVLTQMVAECVNNAVPDCPIIDALYRA